MNLLDSEDAENFAKICLKKLVSAEYAELSKGESPDWSGTSGFSHGVEVTHAMTQDDGAFIKLSSQNISKAIEKIEKQQKEIKEGKIIKKRINACVLNLGGKKYLSQSMGYRYTSRHYDNAVGAINKKLEKLNNVYRHFDSNELFVFITFPLHIEDIRAIVSQSAFSNYAIKFDVIFFWSSIDLFIYKYRDDAIEQKTISDEQLSIINHCHAQYLTQKGNNK